VWKTRFYFASGGSSCPRNPLRIGINASSILHAISMLWIMNLICSRDTRARVEVVRVTETPPPPATP